MKRMAGGLAAALAAIAIFSVSGFGQASATSSLSGVVIAPSGAVIPGVEFKTINRWLKNI